MPESAIPGAMEALYQALKASSALAALTPKPALVDNGFPAGGPQPPYHVWVPAEVDDWNRDYDLSGDPPSVIEETFRLRVYAVAFVARDGTFRDHVHRFTPLVDAIHRAVHVDPLLGGAVRLALTAAGSIGESMTPNHRVLNGVVWVECQATVTTP